MKKKLVVLTGISAESGIKTFRDMAFGKGIMFKIATPEGWRNNPALVI
jgi:NAD-dependent SIR2 family protein deacetylase